MVKKLLPIALIGFGVPALFGCTVSTGVPGVPDVDIVPSSSAIQTVCRDFGRDLGRVSSTEELLDAIVVAEAAAADAAMDDPGARSVVESLQGVLSTTSKAAVEIAITDVMAACTDVGVPMSWEE